MAPRTALLLLLMLAPLVAGCRDAGESSSPREPAPERTANSDDGVVVTRALRELARTTATAWHSQVRAVGRRVAAAVPLAPRPAPIVAARGPVAMADVGLAFDTDRPLRVVEHTGGQWTFEELTDAGPARVRIGMKRGALALDGVEAADLLDGDFEGFVERWHQQSGEVLEARRVPATASAPAWAWISRRDEDGARVDLAIFVVDEAATAPGNARVVLVQVDGDGVGQSRIGQSLMKSARLAPVTEVWLDDSTLRRLDMPVELRLPEGWRRAPDEVAAGRLAAIGTMVGAELNAPRLTIRSTGRAVVSLQAGLEAFRTHIAAAGGVVEAVEAGRFRGRPALRYAAREPGAEPLHRRGVLTLTPDGAMLAIDVAQTGRDPSGALDQVLSGLGSGQAGDAVDHPADEQGD